MDRLSDRDVIRAMDVNEALYWYKADEVADLVGRVWNWVDILKSKAGDRLNHDDTWAVIDLMKELEQIVKEGK